MTLLLLRVQIVPGQPGGVPGESSARPRSHPAFLRYVQLPTRQGRRANKGTVQLFDMGVHGTVSRSGIRFTLKKISIPVRYGQVNGVKIGPKCPLVIVTACLDRSVTP